jgi:hypothetical protein
MWRLKELSATLSLKSSDMESENRVRVQYVTPRKTFCFCYHITTKRCIVRTELVWNVWRKVATYASVIT